MSLRLSLRTFPLIVLAATLLFAQEAAEEGPPEHTLKPAEGPKVPTEWLAKVSDGFGVGRDEADAYFAILDHARTVPLAKQQELATQTQAKRQQEFKARPENRKLRYSPFADLVQNRGERRGQPVSLRGYIRRLETMDAGDNPKGLKTLYQCWLWTKDSGTTPYTVVFSELPKNFPRVEPEDSVGHVSVTGYFFKVWSYTAATEEGRWASPLILAGRLEYSPPQSAGAGISTEQVVAILVGGTLLAAGIAWFTVSRSRAARRERRLAQQDAEIAEALRSGNITHEP